MALRRSLPGIRFEGRTPPLRDPLPRMDIPAFVGFAASGPIDVPVPIEDPGEFRMIFGRDVALPRRRGAAEAAAGHLGAAVRGFFANGGRRCWIVRVAGRGAAANRFVLPGVARVTSSGQVEPVEIEARSEGSWSDSLGVRTNLVSRPLAFIEAQASTTGATIDVALSARGELAPGDLVRVTWTAAGASLHLFVQQLTPLAASPLAAGVVTRIGGRSLWLNGAATVVTAPPQASLAGPVMAERLTFDLTVASERGASDRLAALGFAPDHPRYLGAVPTDVALFEQAVDAFDGAAVAFRPPQSRWLGLWRDASRPRFPLACVGDDAVFVPTDMGVLPTGSAARAISLPATSLERDGLARFDTSLFLDAELADATLRDMLDRAEMIRYRATPTRRLTGIHGVLAIEEATMVAVPDLLHAGWNADLANALASPLASSPLDHPEWWRWLDCREPRPSPPPPAFSGFVDCAVTAPIPPPLIQVIDVTGGSYRLQWDARDGAVDEIQEALHFDFADAVTIAHETDGMLALYDRPAGDYYYRARRLVGARSSDWSLGVAVRVPSLSGWVAREVSDPGTLLAVQRALVRLCAATADRVALLALPLEYDASMAIAHAAALTAAPTEPSALSYATLWHPWVIRRDGESGALRAAPPEGVMAAVMAARAIARGAWIAPANEALRGVVALAPAIPPAAHQAIQDAAINLVRHEPSGFVCLNADTLALEEDVRPLNVRRLLMLIRKAALRAGNRFVFEPNGERLRRAVKRGFDAMLEEMFARGAFAGRRSREAFQVATDEPPNSARHADEGRYLAEIRIAPSRPLSFLTVRLVQRGESTAAEEVH